MPASLEAVQDAATVPDDEHIRAALCLPLKMLWTEDRLLPHEIERRGKIHNTRMDHCRCR